MKVELTKELMRLLKLDNEIKILYKFYLNQYSFRVKNKYSTIETEIFCLHLGTALGKDENIIREDLKHAIQEWFYENKQ